MAICFNSFFYHVTKPAESTVILSHGAVQLWFLSFWNVEFQLFGKYCHVLYLSITIDIDPRTGT